MWSSCMFVLFNWVNDVQVWIKKRKHSRNTCEILFYIPNAHCNKNKTKNKNQTQWDTITIQRYQNIWYTYWPVKTAPLMSCYNLKSWACNKSKFCMCVEWPMGWLCQNFNANRQKLCNKIHFQIQKVNDES